MIRIEIMNKQEKAVWLPELFDLLYGNMRTIAPSALPYEEERENWMGCVSPALDREPRQILLCFSDEKVAGYLQFYTRGELLMVEEVQLKKEYQRTMVFFRLCRALMEMLPEEISTVEAYADRRNGNSLRIMEKLGMVRVGENGGFVHLRGPAVRARRRFLKR